MYRCVMRSRGSFTIIAPGPSDIDQDGPALVGDPDMGFLGLRQFGPSLIHQTQLKVREMLPQNMLYSRLRTGFVASLFSPLGRRECTLRCDRRRTRGT